MPYSYSKYKAEVKEEILKNLPKTSHILDVGAGSGCYGEMFSGKFTKIDALEIFPNYIDMFDLHKKYDKVIIGDIREFDYSNYDFIIMGDVLEHLAKEDAQDIIDKINMNGQGVLVAVPYLYEQGTEFGNVHETHLQPDLTPQIMAERYPSLKLLFGDEQYGYYVNSHLYKCGN